MFCLYFVSLCLVFITQFIFRSKWLQTDLPAKHKPSSGVFVYSDSLVVLVTWAGTAAGSSRSFQGRDGFFPTVFTFLQAQQLGEVGLPPLQLLHVLLQDGDVLVQDGLEGETNTPRTGTILRSGRKKSQTLGFIALWAPAVCPWEQSRFFFFPVKIQPRAEQLPWRWRNLLKLKQN